MSKIFGYILGTILIVVVIAGCNVEKTVYVDRYIDEIPPPPAGLNSITGDEAIYLYWHPVEVEDIEGYRLYWNDTPEGLFELMVDLDHPDTDWVDNDVTNGETYYYRVSAYDEDGNESDLSDAYAFDTPRPEGFDEVIYVYDLDPNNSGFDLARGENVAWNDDDCDIYLDYDTVADAFFINVRFDDYYIQDFGYADDFDDVGYAPLDGWSGFNSVEAIEGHMYILKLWHFEEWHYARIWITNLFNSPQDGMEFSWAYQVDEDNRELKINPDAVKHESIQADAQ